MEASVLSILKNFAAESEPVSYEEYGCGHINRSYLVTYADGSRCILQRINDRTFPDVDGLMENIRRVTEHLRRRSEDERSVLTFLPTRDGGDYVRTDSGCWRLSRFVEGSLCLQSAETPADFYESAVGFGRFQELLSDFDAAQLHEVIPHFHDTPDRFRIFHESLRRDAAGRAKDVQPDIDFFLRREQKAGLLEGLRRSGALPTRVTHNDTKLNNVLFDAATRKALCVIDLDTVMPGLSLYDFGDAIRFGASTAAEDEQDLGKVSMSPVLFESFTRGYLTACPSLTEAEIEHLPGGARIITLEIGLRFLTDYLDGDVYFATHRPGHNLDRCRTQMKLVQDMEAKWEEMQRIVRNAGGKA